MATSAGSTAPPPAWRPAPEAVAAEAEAHATAFQESAARLRAAGLVAEAEELEKKASAQRKKADLPSLAKRIDMKEVFIQRAEARVQKAG